MNEIQKIQESRYNLVYMSDHAKYSNKGRKNHDLMHQ